MAASVDVVVRQRRQITLPAEIYEKLGLDVGDRLELRLEGDMVTVRPKKSIAMNTLQQIRQALADESVTEEDLLQAGRTERSRLVKDRYGRKA